MVEQSQASQPSEQVTKRLASPATRVTYVRTQAGCGLSTRRSGSSRGRGHPSCVKAG